MSASASAHEHSSTPLYDLFEIKLINRMRHDNPFADVDLNALFIAPSGREVEFFGFFDGDENGGEDGHVWKQRFMPDEIGTWRYALTFSDGSPGASGAFECVSDGAKPGPWKQDAENPRWFRTARGERFLPIAMYAACCYTPLDWTDAIEWCAHRQFNTLITSTFNTWAWGDARFSPPM